ncbi:MAG: molybdopterin molybdotransferase MoeA [Thermodesulfovibrionales bacterium]|nr:molybdopterin molybdotransferase MoeA [Thermodesulfovibrionales bacterium]
MLGREEVITVESALELIFSNLSPKLPPERSLKIDESYGRILSRDVFSPEDLPDFSRSTVDGFAVSASDTFGATEGMPAYLNIRYEILMGKEPDFELKKGEVAKIATGGMLPKGADAVVMLEHTQQIDEGMIEVVKPVAPGENVIQPGEDVKKGDCVLKKGHKMRPQDMGVLAGLGINDVWVYERQKGSIVSTGDEIVPPGRPVKPGQVRDINSYNLAGLLLDAGAIPLIKGIFKDEYNIIRDVVEKSLRDSDIVLVSGGSSVGTKDVTAQVIDDLGRPGVLFHGVSLKPGKPLIGGIVNNIPIFGLPGHPAAVSVCFEIFIRPVLRALSGLSKVRFKMEKRTIKARIARNISSSPGREEHIGVYLEERGGEIWAVPILGKSGLITTLIRADGTAVIPLRKLGVEEGEIVEVRLF